MQAAWMNIKPLEVLETVELDNSWVQRVTKILMTSHQPVLPQGSKITSTRGHGASYWSRTARIDTLLPNGEERSYFLKLATPNGGLMMCHGEYESMTALYAVSPNFVPKPVNYGTYKSNPEQHFFLCEFIDLDDELPHVVEFCQNLAQLHQRSQELAPQLHNPHKMFGFHVITCNGTVPTHQIWCESWEEFYTDNMKHLFGWEEKMQGPSQRLQELLPDLYGKVIPRLLRPLETEGRTLKPSLLHGDLWDGNTAVHTRTDAPYIFDASSFWGHNECDLAKWRGSRYRMRRMYVKEYFKHCPISPPEEDCEDRNLLYSLRADLHDSILFPTTPRFRELLIITLEKLTNKFPNGYEGPAKRKSTETVTTQAMPQVAEMPEVTSRVKLKDMQPQFEELTMPTEKVIVGSELHTAEAPITESSTTEMPIVEAHVPEAHSFEVHTAEKPISEIPVYKTATEHKYAVADARVPSTKAELVPEQITGGELAMETKTATVVDL